MPRLSPILSRILPRTLFAALVLMLAQLAGVHGAVRAANNDPIVLVHGFLGFGPEQFPRSGFLYRGGYGDLAAHLRSYKGPHTVLTAVVGAIAGNRERAAELYAQLKGGCADYGAAAATHKTPRCWAADPARNPMAYPAAPYPEWDAGRSTSE